MLVKVGAGSAAIDRSPDVLEANEHRAAHPGIGNEWNIEGGSFFTGNERVGYVIPAERIVALKVYISIGTIVRVHADIGIARVNEGLAAVTADRLEPVDRVRAIGPCAVVLGATDNIGVRALRIKGEALELDGCQAVIQAEDLGGDGLQPVLSWFL